jgi:hypothetical protein
VLTTFLNSELLTPIHYWMQGTTVKYSIVLLTDFPTTKTVCIAPVADAEASASRMHTQIMRLFLTTPASTEENMITVVIKGAELPHECVETLVAEFFAQRAQDKAPYVVDIDAEELAEVQARKSKMNSTLSSRPPRAI